MIKLDKELFRALLHYHIRMSGLPLTPDNWEKIVAESTGSKWVGKSRDLADCVHDDSKTIISVKTAIKEPKILKRKESRDFTTNPECYDIHNLRQVSRRCGLPKNIDDQKHDPKVIGLAAWKNFKDIEAYSLKKYSCEHTLDISIIHSISRDGNEYIARVSCYDHDIPDVGELEWRASMFGDGSRYKGSRANVTGYRNDIPVIGRNGGRGGHEQNCFFRFYKLDEALWTEDIRCPIPSKEPFSYTKELKLMEDVDKSKSLC